jgi:hypothetical protein
VENPIKTNGFTSSVGAGGIFKHVNLNDSYSYNPEFRIKIPSSEEQLFTDPELLRTIKKELEYL